MEIFSWLVCSICLGNGKLVENGKACKHINQVKFRRDNLKNIISGNNHSLKFKFYFKIGYSLEWLKIQKVQKMWNFSLPVCVLQLPSSLPWKPPMLFSHVSFLRCLRCLQVNMPVYKIVPIIIKLLYNLNLLLYRTKLDGKLT